MFNLIQIPPRTRDDMTHGTPRRSADYGTPAGESHWDPHYSLRVTHYGASVILMRMHLLGAKIKGFKSFADTFDLRFDAGVTAIIGPNGSGKSNLAEAIRWVLGEQSLKQLRGKESADVIFSGSAKRAAARNTSVELLFSNESGRFQVDSPEVSLGRRLRRDGESEYTLNGDAVRLSDIQHLLAQAGIGAKSYTVISQGMVDQYVTSSSVGRRELFEEATGVKALQLKMKEGQRKLEKAQQHMHELTLVSQEMQPRLKVLEREARRYGEKEGLQEKFEIEQGEWLTHQWHQLTSRLARCEQELTQGRQQASQAGAQREALEKTLFTAAGKPEDMGLQPLRQALAEAERSFALAQERQTATKARRRDTQEQIVTVKNTLHKAENLLAARKAEAAQFDFLKIMRGQLHEAAQALRSRLSGQEWEEEEIRNLLKRIEHVMETTSDETTFEGARSLLAHLEKPIAEVARAQALLKEHERQLASLVLLPALPSPIEIHSLRAKLVEAEAAQEAGIDLPQLHRDLTHLREEESLGERAAGAAIHEKEELEKTFEYLHQTILRERGTAFWESLPNSQHPEGPVVKPEDITRMAATLTALDEIDPLVVKEYEEVRNRYEQIVAQLADAHTTQENILALVADLEAKIAQQFTSQLAVIAAAFSEYFTRLFDGGTSSLTLTNEGIEIFVQLPGKKARHVQLLSGGERALTALALLFAVLKVQKPPFLVLDEVDAALDEANADRFARLLRDVSYETQCIVITHNRATMGYAHTLYGVTMSEPGVSKVYSLKLQEVSEEVRGIEMEMKI